MTEKATDREVILEIYGALVLLGAESDLLGVIGSWKSDLSNDHVVGSLRAWSFSARDRIKRRIEHYEMSLPHWACIPDEFQ